MFRFSTRFAALLAVCITLSQSHPAMAGTVRFATHVRPTATAAGHAIGTSIAARGAIQLTPFSSALFAGDSFFGTASLQNPNGDPLAGAAVQFTIFGGPNAGNPGSGPAVTDADGLAGFDYMSTRNGVDSLVATFVDASGTLQTSNVITVEWAGGDDCPAFTAPTPADRSTVVVHAGDPIALDVRATDANPGDTVTLAALGLPASATFSPGEGNPASGSFRWTPSYADLGRHVLTFNASDNAAAACTTSTGVTIDVQCPLNNRAPEFTAPACGATVVTLAGQLVTLPVAVRDADTGDAVTLTASGPGALVAVTPGNPASGRYEWRTGAADIGVHVITLTATDRCGGTSDCSTTVRVDDPQVCPRFIAPTPAEGAVLAATAGAEFSLPVRAADANAGDRLTLSVDGAPAVTFTTSPGNPVDGTLLWAPTRADLGQHAITFTVIDHAATPCAVSRTVQVLVACPAGNAAPVFTAPACGATLEAAAGQPLSFPVAAADPDAGDAVTLAMTGAGALTIVPGNPPTARFDWTPAAADSGSRTLAFTATDRCSLTTRCEVTVHVMANRPPDGSAVRPSISVLWPANHKLVPVTLTGATDPDGDSVRVEITGITQDEPLTGGKGAECGDAVIAAGVPSLRAERSGDNGRVYEIRYRATDGRGGFCEGAVHVCVPHDNGSGGGCVDDGQRFSSLGLCGPSSSAVMNPVTAVSLDVADLSSRDVTLEYALPADADVRIAVYDITGRRLALLEDARRAQGTYAVTWHAGGLARGVYYCRMTAGDRTVTRAVVLAR